MWEEEEDIQQEILQDQKLSKIIENISQGELAEEGYHLIADRLHYKDRMEILRGSDWAKKKIWECHISPIGGHLGVLKTLQ